MPANWFIALPVPAGAWFEAVQPPSGVRRFASSDLHLTVAFLGAVSPERASRAFEHARSFPLPKTVVRLGPIEALGSRRRPAAFAAVVEQGRLQVEHAVGLARPAMWEAAGSIADPRPPLAHVTLARPMRRATAGEIERALSWAKGLRLEGALAQLERIALYTWAEDRATSLFRMVAELPLLAANGGAPNA